MNSHIRDIITIHVRMYDKIILIKNKLKKNHIFRTDESLVGPRELTYELHITNDDTNLSWSHTTCYLFNDIFNNGYRPIKINSNYKLSNFMKDLTTLERTLDNIINDGYFAKYNIIDDAYDIFTTIIDARNYTHMLIQAITEYTEDYTVSEEDE